MVNAQGSHRFTFHIQHTRGLCLSALAKRRGLSKQAIMCWPRFVDTGKYNSMLYGFAFFVQFSLLPPFVRPFLN